MKKEHEELEDDDGEVTDEDEAGEIDEAQLAKIKPKEEVRWCGVHDVRGNVGVWGCCV